MTIIAQIDLQDQHTPNIMGLLSFLLSLHGPVEMLGKGMELDSITVEIGEQGVHQIR